MHSDITAVTAQSNKMASNEARQLCATRDILQEKKKKRANIFVHPVYSNFKKKKYSFSVS